MASISDEETMADLEALATREENMAEPDPGSSSDSEMTEPGQLLTQGSRGGDVPVYYSQQVDDSMDHDLVHSQQQQDDDVAFDKYLKEYTIKTDISLRNVESPIVVLPIQEEDQYNFLLGIKTENETTMDSASKAFRLIPRLRHCAEDTSGDHNYYMRPFEGSPYYFCSETNSMAIPRHIEDVLYFFYMLKTYIEQHGITNFAIPTEKLILEHNRNIRTANSKVVSSIIEESVEMLVDNLSGEAHSTTFDSVQSIFQARTKQGGSELKEERDLFSIRVAFTGAVFESEGEFKQSLFCLGVITPLKNFDLYGYIRHVFLAPPKMPQLMDLWKDLCALWKHIVMYEANYNCSLFENPMTYENNPGGKLGFFTLTNMLNAPIRMYNVVKRNYPQAENVYILGCPKLSFRSDLSMSDYVKYMHKTINVTTQVYENLQRDIEAFNTTKQEEQTGKKFDVISCGGWPLKVHESGKFQRFGHFRWPIFMTFEMQKIMAEQLKKSGFLMNYGGLPLSVEKKLRDFCTFDPEAENGGLVPDEHILKSTEEATPLRILETYYNFDLVVMEEKKEARLLIWYEAFRQHILHGRKEKYMTPLDAISQMNRHIVNCMEQHRCIARINGYGSDIVKQYMYFADNMEKTRLHNVSVKTFVKHFLDDRCPCEIRHNAFMRQAFAYLSALSNLNMDMNLNALNLEAFVSIMIASCHWMMGAHSNTFIAFAQCVFMAGGVGHLDVTLEKDQPQMDWRKQNSTGAGFIQVSMNVNFNELAKLYGQTPEKNKTKVQSFFRSTKVAIEGECCETFMNDQKVSEPSPETKFCNFIWSENRKKITDWETVITTMFPRDGENSDGWSLSTADPSKGSNLRATIKKRHITHLFVLLFCTNEKPDIGDVPQTIGVVLDMIDPGAEAYEEEGQRKIAFNSVRCKRGEGRQSFSSDMERQLVLLKYLFFSSILTRVHVALPHRAGMFPFSIDKVSNAFLDWCYAALKHVECIMNSRVRSNFGRIKQGAESKQVAWSMMIQTLIALTVEKSTVSTVEGTRIMDNDPTAAAIEATKACAFSALPITEVPCVIERVLRRSIDAGLISITAVFAHALNVPVIPVEDLCEFYLSEKCTEQDSPYAKEAYGKIRAWVQWLSWNNCFCPDDSSRPFCKQGNIKCYVSSPGNPDGSISDDKAVRRVLRMGPMDRGSRCLLTAVSDLISHSYGAPLRKYCHFGPELSILRNLLRSLTGMEVDLRALFNSSPIYNTKKHVQKLGLQSDVPGLGMFADDSPGKYVCEFEWKESGNGLKSQGLGVNMWALLTLVSLLGSKDIHCKARGRASQALLKLILKMSPSACTPGGVLPIRSFHDRSVEPEVVFVSLEGRCDHFLRPIDDDNFAYNGVFSYCGLVNGKMPEDLLGCAGVQAMADFFQCKYVEIPPSEVYCQYNLQWQRYHHIYRHDDGMEGNIYIDAENVSYSFDGWQSGETWPLDTWEQDLKKKGFLVLPTIWRSGALVLMPDRKSVGCLVPMRTPGKISNYDHEKQCYHAQVGEGEYVQVSPLYVLDNLINPGTEVWIRHGEQTWKSLRDFLPPAPQLESRMANSRWIKARLNVPMVVDPKPGDVYLTVLQRSRASHYARDMSYRHLVASAWEISPVPPEDETLRITELHV